MSANFPAGQVLGKADKCFGVCIVNYNKVQYNGSNPLIPHKTVKISKG
jgi:hypothetical protein